MNAEWVANSETSLQTMIGDLREMWRANKYVKVKATTGKKRSQDQNAISHVWYEQIANELREDTALGIKCECKLYYGVPILRAENDDFRVLYDACIRPLTNEAKLALMKYMPITSEMNKDQLGQYLKAMQDAYDGRVALTFPEQQAA